MLGGIVFCLLRFFIGVNKIFGVFEQSERRKLKDEGESDEHEYYIYNDDEALVESFGHDAV